MQKHVLLLLLMSCSSFVANLDSGSGGGSGGLGGGASSASGGGGFSGLGGGTAGESGGGTPSGSGGGTAGGSDAGTSTVFDGGVFGGNRPVLVHAPPSYVHGTPMPLVVMLHGYTATGPQTEANFKFAQLADSRGFLYVTPTGPTDKNNKPYWNATDACCDFFDAKPKIDDSTYLSNLIKEISSRYTVNPKAVYLLGLSAGGFMAYRMACDHGDQIAAIVSNAGAMWSNPAKCPAKTPVNVLHIHGDLDTTTCYNGCQFGSGYCPSTADTVADWVTFNQCNKTADTSAPNRDLNSVLDGGETTVTSYHGCANGGSVEFWMIKGQGHKLDPSPTFNSQLIDYLLAHPKP